MLRHYFSSGGRAHKRSLRVRCKLTVLGFLPLLCILSKFELDMYAGLVKKGSSGWITALTVKQTEF